MNSPALTLADDEVLECPFAAYKNLRDDHPVYRDPVSGVYVVTRYADPKTVAANPKLLSNTAGHLSDAGYTVNARPARILNLKAYPDINTVVSADPPLHTKYRKLVDGAFRLSRVEQLQTYMQGSADEPDAERLIVPAFAGGLSRLVLNVAHV